MDESNVNIQWTYQTSIRFTGYIIILLTKLQSQIADSKFTVDKLRVAGKDLSEEFRTDDLVSDVLVDMVGTKLSGLL